MSTWKSFDAPNIGLLFYKHIYKEAGISKRVKIKDNELIIDVPPEEKGSPFDAFYQDIYNLNTDTLQQLTNPCPNGQYFSLYTEYPGLLIGSGYAHDTKAKGDFKIGFFFDHTSGQPIIPGSSVKGALRNAFEIDINDKGNSYTGSQSLDYIRWLLHAIGKEDISQNLNETKLNGIKAEIFGDKQQAGRDVFLDAVINIAETKQDHFLSSDFITPHQPYVLKNPTPIQFLKVRAQVAWEFRFNLTTSDSGFSPEVKQQLFEQIILEMGVGAKTNVGYGQFTKQLKQQRVSTAINEIIEDSAPAVVTKPRREFVETIPSAVRDKLKSGRSFTGQVVEMKGEYAFVTFEVEKKECVIRKNYKSIKKNDKAKLASADELEEGDEVVININRDYLFGDNLNCGVKLINK